MPTCPSTALDPGGGQGGRARPQKPRPTAPETRRRALAADAPVRAPAARSAAAGQSTLPTASTPAARGRPRGHGPAPPPQSGHAASPRCPEPRTFQLSSGRFFHPKALCPHPRAATPAMIQPLSRGLAGAGGLRPLGPSLRGWGQLLRGGPWHWLPLLVCSRVGSQGCTLPRGRPGCHVSAGSGACRWSQSPRTERRSHKGQLVIAAPVKTEFPAGLVKAQLEAESGRREGPWAATRHLVPATGEDAEAGGSWGAGPPASSGRQGSSLRCGGDGGDRAQAGPFACRSGNRKERGGSLGRAAPLGPLGSAPGRRERTRRLHPESRQATAASPRAPGRAPQHSRACHGGRGHGKRA